MRHLSTRQTVCLRRVVDGSDLAAGRRRAKTHRIGVRGNVPELEGVRNASLNHEDSPSRADRCGLLIYWISRVRHVGSAIARECTSTVAPKKCETRIHISRPRADREMVQRMRDHCRGDAGRCLDCYSVLHSPSPVAFTGYINFSFTLLLCPRTCPYAAIRYSARMP